MPQPRPIAYNTTAAAAAPIDTVLPNHVRPEAAAPDAKRPKIELLPPYGQGLFPAPIAPAVVPPPPPPAIPVGSLPADSDLEPNPVKDAVEIETIMSEAEFAKSLSNSKIYLLIKIPNDPTYEAWNFNGQTISITVDVMTAVKDIKQQLQSRLGGMPLNKMQLRSSNIGFLKDNLSLAYFNIGPSNNSLELIPKIRGGRR
jgi:splicing factor 3A subunit 1